MTETDAKSPNTNKVLVVTALGVAVLGLVFMALRPSSDSDKKSGTEGVSGAATVAHSAPSEPASTSSSPAATGEVHAAAPSAAAPSSGTTAPSGSIGPITSGAPVDMAQLLLEAKTVEAARSALASGNPKKALKELEFYDKIPNASSLRQEATLLKIEALSLVGRKAEARALAYSTRDDPSFNSYQGRIETLLENDAGH